MGKLVFILLVGLPFVLSQQNMCTPTYRSMTHCLSRGPLSISCPAGHSVFVAHATVFRARGPTNACPAVHSRSNSCRVSDIQPWIQSQCGTMSYCSYNVPPPDYSSCTGYDGALYVQVYYQCEGKFECNDLAGQYARAISMSTGQYSWTGSHAQIDSYPSGLLGNFVEKTSGVCCIRLPAHTMMLVTPSAFIKNPAQGTNNCNQRLEVSDASGLEDTLWICDQATTPTREFGCYNEEKWFTVKYVSSDVTVGVVFGVQVDVDHEKSFTIECGLQEYQCQPPSTIPPSSSTLPPSPSPAPKKDYTNIIIGVVVAAVIIMLLVLIICCCTCRRREYTEQEVIVEEECPASSGYAFVTGMYLEGDNKSDLVIYRNPATNATEPVYGAKSISYSGM